jgi:hypothetical protein
MGRGPVAVPNRVESTTLAQDGLVLLGQPFYVLIFLMGGAIHSNRGTGSKYAPSPCRSTI